MSNLIKMVLEEGAKKPWRATEGSAGFDLFSCESKIIGSRETAQIDTGVRLQIPVNVFGNIRSRSGLAKNHSIWAFNGVIDSDYRGTIKILLINHGKNNFVVESGMRIAQILFTRVECVEIVKDENLDDTQRSDNGWGHSGMK